MRMSDSFFYYYLPIMLKEVSFNEENMCNYYKKIDLGTN